MKKRSGILWITRSAVFIALLIVMQAVTAPLANTLITGSIVNLILIISAMMSGVWSGIAVACVSPVLAKLFGIGPLWSLIPFIMLGNASLVIVWSVLSKTLRTQRDITHVISAIVAAVVKFLVLYVGVVRIAVPVLLDLSEKQSAVISGMFSVPQLFTALIGGAIACLILPVLMKAVEKRRTA